MHDTLMGPRCNTLHIGISLSRLRPPLARTPCGAILCERALGVSCSFILSDFSDAQVDMASAEKLLGAVQRIHEAPLAPDGWMRALPSIAAVVRSQQVNFHVQDASGQTVGFVIGFGLDPDHFARFKAAATSGALDPWWNAVTTGATVRRSEMRPDHQFRRTAFYNEIVRPVGSFHGIATPFLRLREYHACLINARMLGRDDFEAEDVTSMQALVPHLATALRVSHRLAAADLRAAGACAALDRLETGVILVDAAGGMLFANQIAEAILSRGDGLSTHKGALCASDPRATRALRRLIALCADATLGNDGSGDAVCVARGEGRAPLDVVVAPLGSEQSRAEITLLGAARPAAILIVTDPEREREQRRGQLHERFGLTPAESDVAQEIIKGDGRRAAATRLGISLATARTHLERIFEKTGVHRQAELVRLLFQTKSAAGER